MYQVAPASLVLWDWVEEQAVFGGAFGHVANWQVCRHWAGARGCPDVDVDVDVR